MKTPSKRISKDAHMRSQRLSQCELDSVTTVKLFSDGWVVLLLHYLRLQLVGLFHCLMHCDKSHKTHLPNPVAEGKPFHTLIPDIMTEKVQEDQNEGSLLCDWLQDRILPCYTPIEIDSDLPLLEEEI
uniref:Uncharacterized protein n=1 Tax=Timema douglasi TaxID=61478 RepID=A0A7R8ZE28_TIMDO|nr:unnamed protein product [Timema douglasi]